MPLLASIAGSRHELVGTVGISALIGAATGAAITGGTPRGLSQGGLSGALVSLFVTVARAVAARGPSRWRFGLYLAASASLSAVAICAGLAVASLPWVARDGVADWDDYATPFAVSVLASIGFTWWFALDRLLGGGVLVGLLTGRYHQPRREARVFLFADLEGSTAAAERLGELRYHEFLNRVFSDAALPVEEHGGAIYQYVGDEVVVTWPQSHGLEDWRCLRCAFAVRRLFADKEREYLEQFGVAPRFRFAIHCGAVVVGELGDLRREIVYSGETVNTAARIEAVAKELGIMLVASEDVVGSGSLAPELTAESLGSHHLRGKEQPVELFAVNERG